jgi:hypothetical protein
MLKSGWARIVGLQHSQTENMCMLAQRSPSAVAHGSLLRPDLPAAQHGNTATNHQGGCTQACLVALVEHLGARLDHKQLAVSRLDALNVLHGGTRMRQGALKACAPSNVVPCMLRHHTIHQCCSYTGGNT